MAAEPFIATCVRTPRSIKSMSRGATPVFTTWPPIIATTARPARCAAMIAATTARKSRATSTSGSESTNAPNVIAGPPTGGRANSVALTLFGRRATGTVRTAVRSASRATLRGFGTRSLSAGSAAEAAGRDVWLSLPACRRGRPRSEGGRSRVHCSSCRRVLPSRPGTSADRGPRIRN